jgi:LPXTG-motif cell wall-anchored protein
VTRRGTGSSSAPWIIAAVALAFGLGGVALALRSRRA